MATSRSAYFVAEDINASLIRKSATKFSINVCDSSEVKNFCLTEPIISYLYRSCHTEI